MYLDEEISFTLNTNVRGKQTQTEGLSHRSGLHEKHHFSTLKMTLCKFYLLHVQNNGPFYLLVAVSLKIEIWFKKMLVGNKTVNNFIRRMLANLP